MILNNFSSALSFVQQSSYFLIFLAMVLEGPFVTAAAAFAASLGVFNIYIIFILSLFGDLVGDFIHYLLGSFGRKTVIEKYGERLGLKESRLRKIENHLKNHLGKALFAIKFTPVLTTPGLLLAGALKVSVKRFILFSFIITLPRTLFFILIGFYFGVAFDKISRYFRLGGYAVILAIVLTVIIYLIIKKVSEAASKDVKKIEKL